MNFALTDEQKMLTDAVRRFIHDHLRPLEDEVEATGALAPERAKALHEQAKALGLYAMNMPEALGGGGLSHLDRILCEEQFGHTSDILIRRAFGNVYEPLLHCKGPQIDRWLTPAVAGERTCAIAITEPGAGSDAAGIERRQTFHQRRRVERLLFGLGANRRQRDFDVHGRQGPARLHRRQRPKNDGAAGHPAHGIVF